MEQQKCKLIESVAEKIAKSVLVNYPIAQKIIVRVRKPHVAVSGVVDALAIEIVRDRGDL